MAKELRGLMLHIQQGHMAGTDATFKDPARQVSAHFGGPLAGQAWQWVDTDDEAWAEAAGNGYWISLELEGFSGQKPAPTANQVEIAAQLLAWLYEHHAVPLRIARTVNERGLAYHGLGGSPYGNHPDCPGPRVLRKRRRIVRRAKRIVRHRRKAGDLPAR